MITISKEMAERLADNVLDLYLSLVDDPNYVNHRRVLIQDLNTLKELIQ